MVVVRIAAPDDVTGDGDGGRSAGKRQAVGSSDTETDRAGGRGEEPARLMVAVSKGTREGQLRVWMWMSVDDAARGVWWCWER